MRRSREEKIAEKLFSEGAGYVHLYASVIGFISLVLTGYAIEFGLISISPIRAFVLAGVIAFFSVFLAYGMAQLRSPVRAKERIEIDLY